MARIRSVDGDQFQNPKLRKLPLLERFLFGYLCAGAADDEGRFPADPEAILDAVFPRGDATTADQVNHALQALRKAGLVVIYRAGGHSYGFLTGWFEHQRIDNFHPSALPPPPAKPGAVTSRAQAEQIKSEYEKATNKPSKQAWGRDAIRWWTERQRTQNAPLTSRQRTVNESLTSRQPDRTGLNQKEPDRREPNSSPPDGAGQLSTELSTIPEPELLNAISEPENGNGHDPAVTQVCANISFLLGEKQELTPGLIREQCKPHPERSRIEPLVMAEFGFTPEGARAP